MVRATTRACVLTPAGAAPQGLRKKALLGGSCPGQWVLQLWAGAGGHQAEPEGFVGGQGISIAPYTPLEPVCSTASLMSFHIASSVPGSGLEASRKPTHQQVLPSTCTPQNYTVTSTAHLPLHSCLLGSPSCPHWISHPPLLPAQLWSLHLPTVMPFPFLHVQAPGQQEESAQTHTAHRPGDLCPQFCPQFSVPTCNQIPLKEGLSGWLGTMSQPRQCTTRLMMLLDFSLREKVQGHWSRLTTWPCTPHTASPCSSPSLHSSSDRSSSSPYLGT